MVALPKVDPNSSSKDVPIIMLLVEEEFNKQLKELLATTADHYKVTRSLIEVLGPSMPGVALEIADSLNVEPRRDRAKSDLIEAALNQRASDIPFGAVSQIINKIADSDIAQ